MNDFIRLFCYGFVSTYVIQNISKDITFEKVWMLFVAMPIGCVLAVVIYYGCQR